MNVEAKTIVVHTRLRPSQYNLLDHISQHTKLKKSSLIRAAVTEWLKNMPADLPLDLQVEITRANMQHIIETIKNLRWTYHQLETANARIIELEHTSKLPPHTQQTIRQLEQSIIKLQKQLDTWIKQQYINQQKGETT